MAVVRFTMLFHHESSTTSLSDAPPVRVGGWSESFYYEDSTTNPTQVRSMQLKRAALLPNRASIIGQRYQFPDGSSRTANEIFAGTSGESVDVPQMALLCNAKNLTFASTRRFYIRGLPDAWVQNGELVNDIAVRNRFNQYFFWLRYFSWRARNKSAAVADIVSILGNGAFVLASDLTFLPGQQFRIRRAVDQYGRSINGVFRVATRTNDREGTLQGWTVSVVDNRGKVQLTAYQQVPFVPGQVYISRVGVKKVGRSFFQYRGRAGKRKPRAQPAMVAG